MKYFAKYLATEDEIKPGDLITGPTGLCYATTLEYTSDFKKVKLFLCTHDIKGVVGGDGTKVYLSHDPIHKNEEKPFRVLGEISKEATWVQENDEFELSDFNPLSAAFIEHNRVLKDVIKIKCPTCKTYH